MTRRCRSCACATPGSRRPGRSAGTSRCSPGRPGASSAARTSRRASRTSPTPRFAGAGFLYRRAPQVRVSGERGADVRRRLPGRRARAHRPRRRHGRPGRAARRVPSASARASPNVEARVAGVYRPAGKTRAELGVSGHYGREKYSFRASATRAAEDVTTDSRAVRARPEARAPVRAARRRRLLGREPRHPLRGERQGRACRTSPPRPCRTSRPAGSGRRPR